MFQIIQEAVLPKLTQTSLYTKFNENSGISQSVTTALKQMNEYRVTADKIPEIISLMKLNGDVVVKKAIAAFEKGDIVIIHNTETSTIPMSLPFIIASKDNNSAAYVFADKFINNINSPQEYIALMSILEAAYLALLLHRKPNTFLMNRPLMLTLCNIYQHMVVAPMEQKMYMKGENLLKTRLYVITYFYKMIDGDQLSASTIPYKRLIEDKIDDVVVKQIVEEVKALPDLSFMGLINLIKKINPVRYKNLDVMYMTHFVSTCGTSLIFALENIGYLFTLIASSNYKSHVTSYGLNKLVNMPVRKAITLLSSLNE